VVRIPLSLQSLNAPLTAGFFYFIEYATKDRFQEYIAKTGRFDHIWPVRLKLSYITNQKKFNSCRGWL